MVNTLRRSDAAHLDHANWAWKQISDVADHAAKKVADRYGTQVRKLPSLLQVNGLGQTLAFFYSKRLKKNSREPTGDGLLLVQLVIRLSEVLAREMGPRALTRAELDRDPTPAMDWLVALGRDHYRRASVEARVAAEWLKRFAEGKLGEEEDDGG